MNCKELVAVFAIFAILTPNSRAQKRTAANTVSPVAIYLNEKIERLLVENPVKDATEFNLPKAFNEERMKLEENIIRPSSIPNYSYEIDVVKAEQAIRDFKNFLQNYVEISNNLENALDDLLNYEQDPNVPTNKKYEALVLLVKMKRTSTLKDAKRDLRLFNDFKSRLNENKSPTNNLAGNTANAVAQGSANGE